MYAGAGTGTEGPSLLLYGLRFARPRISRRNVRQFKPD